MNAMPLESRSPVERVPTVRLDPVEDDRFRLFGEELDELRREVLAQVGPEDVRHIKNVRRFSTAMEVAGRAAIHLSLDPFTFLAGVGALWLHKQVEATEIGHTVLHGAYDRLEGAEAFASKTFQWDIPIDEESWRHGHNGRHHGATNIAGRDPDMRFGSVRLTPQHEAQHGAQRLILLGFIFPNFAFVMNSHFTGLNDWLLGHRDTLKEATPENVKAAWTKALRKYVPYYLKNYFFYPALAGPFFGKVLLGNVLAEVCRDVYSAATIVCGHTGEDVKSWPAGVQPKSRGESYAMQVEAANDFEVPLPISILCGGLDRQIEHHLFPTLAPPRLRAIAPRVRAICEKHGVAYKTDTWGRTLRKALRHVSQLSKTSGAASVVSAVA
jgi:NADPH-dependent stearoyl-CoA 9-desaturase